jgi:hypothetical protein
LFQLQLLKKYPECSSSRHSSKICFVAKLLGSRNEELSRRKRIAYLRVQLCTPDVSLEVASEWKTTAELKLKLNTEICSHNLCVIEQIVKPFKDQKNSTFCQFEDGASSSKLSFRFRGLDQSTDQHGIARLLHLSVDGI